MHGVVHTEFAANDLKSSSKFFYDLFDWKIEPFMDNYFTWSNGEAGGGLDSKMRDGTKTMVYIEVEDIKASVEKAKDLGAIIHLEYEELPHDAGVIAILSTPEGTPLGLWAKK